MDDSTIVERSVPFDEVECAGVYRCVGVANIVRRSSPIKNPSAVECVAYRAV